MNRDAVKKLFAKEFEAVQSKFAIYDLAIPEAERSDEEHVWKPGVYVFWHPRRGVIKVGRHLTNSRKRALKHLQADTGGVMAGLRKDPDARLLLFNVKEPSDKHWVAALEIFFEERVSPEVQAHRLG